MKITALLTGRGNNTLKDKNVMMLLGHPLLYWPATAAKASRFITNFYVSSEDDKILDAAEACGYTKIRRPAELAQPDSQHVDAVKHALDWMVEHDDLRPDILLVFLANSPTVKTEWIDESIQRILVDPTISSVVPAYQDQDHHPYRCARPDENGFLAPYVDPGPGKRHSTNRQDLPDSLFLCHNYWTLNVSQSVLSDRPGSLPWGFLGERVSPLVVDRCFDIHDLDDLGEAEGWLIRERGIDAALKT